MTKEQREFYKLVNSLGLLGVASNRFELQRQPDLIVPLGFPYKDRKGIYRIHDYVVYKKGCDHALLLEQSSDRGFCFEFLTIRLTNTGEWRCEKFKGVNLQFTKNPHRIIEDYAKEKEKNREGAQLIYMNILKARNSLDEIQNAIRDDECLGLRCIEMLNGNPVIYYQSLLEESLLLTPKALFGKGKEEELNPIYQASFDLNPEETPYEPKDPFYSYLVLKDGTYSDSNLTSLSDALSNIRYNKERQVAEIEEVISSKNTKLVVAMPPEFENEVELA